MKSNKGTSPLELTDADATTNKIYTAIDVQVMMDSDLAKIYGYEKIFNRQEKNNIGKFDEK